MKLEVQKKILSSKEAAEYLGISYSRFYNLVNREVLLPLPGFGRDNNFSVYELDRFLMKEEK